MGIYETIGKTYNRTRRADARIVELLMELLELPAGAAVADIGAGTGNYSKELAKRGLKVYALEPSGAMLANRAETKGLTWHKGFAEEIPFGDGSMDGAVCTLSTHHFASIKKAINEIHRILKPGGRWVIFTADPSGLDENTWIPEYFGEMQTIAIKTLPPRETVTSLIRETFRGEIQVREFPLPDDLVDHFFYAAWKYPERYLDEGFRAGISVFALGSEEGTRRAVARLAEDLASGAWDAKYGHYRTAKTFDGGYYFLSAERAVNSL